MDFLLKDGVRFTKYAFEQEQAFEKVVLNHHTLIFGEHTLLFRKQKIRSETGLGTIPDAFLLDPRNGKWMLIEVELHGHSVHNHIIPQLSKFKMAINHPATRRKITDFFRQEIKNSLHQQARWLDALQRPFDYEDLQHLVEKEPEVLIVIDGLHPQLDDALRTLSFQPAVYHVHAFCRERNKLNDVILHIAPPKATGRNRPSAVGSAHTPEAPVAAPEARQPPAPAQAERARRPLTYLSPDPAAWVGQVPELAQVPGLTGWKAICGYLNITVEKDSARRRLARWVTQHRPHWPAVPEPVPNPHAHAVAEN